MSSIPEFIGPVQPMPTHKQFMSLIGQRFARWTVIAYGGKRHKHKFWHCICDCGSAGMVEGGSLRKGGTTSCGCYKIENAKALFTVHGMQDTPEYKSWLSMRRRCYNPTEKDYQYWAAKGITICDRWQGPQGFLNFYADMGPRPTRKHSLDRIDSGGNYEPSNCRWATAREQSQNRSSVYKITYQGVTTSLKEHCERLGLPYKTIHQRVKSGFDIITAFTAPIVTSGSLIKTLR